MAITYPVMYTPVADKEVEFTRPVSDETVRKIIQNINMLSKLAEIGQIISVAVNQPGVSTPSPLQFQQCDGSEITQENSPLQSTSGSPKFTPDTRDFFLRGAPDESTNGQTAPNLTTNLQHAHSTSTIVQPRVGEGGDERHAYSDSDLPHNHPLSDDLNPAEPIDPANLKIVHYLKIN